MTVKTIWPIDHTCGHHADRDLSDRPADRRAGFAEWLASQLTYPLPRGWGITPTNHLGNYAVVDSSRGSAATATSPKSMAFALVPIQSAPRQRRRAL